MSGVGRALRSNVSEVVLGNEFDCKPMPERIRNAPKLLVLLAAKWYIVLAILGWLADGPEVYLGFSCHYNLVEGGELGMSMRRIISIVLLCVVLASLLSSLLDLSVVGAQTCQAQTEGTIELKWDDGIAMERVSRGVGGCPSCYVFQGVQFTLPEGLSTAVLRAARIYAEGGSLLQLYVTDAKKSSLIEPVNFIVKGADWYDVPLPDIPVSTGFYIWCKVPHGTMIDLSEAEPLYDGGRSGNSLFGDSPSVIRGQPPGDFMIRALIVPVAHVGQGQDYKTIQEAIDAVWDGWTIAVHEGTYNENLTVDKAVTIMSLSGPAKTIVQTSPPYSDSNVFRITASCVRLSGFTIQSAIYTGRAGVRIDDASGCVVSRNVILDSNYGIHVSEASTNNILLENELKFNTIGVYIDGSENYVSGNKLHGNTASIGSAVYLSAIASGNQLRFNTVTLDPGTDSAVAAGPQVYNQNSDEQVSAVENWWGTDSGPSNAGGQGPVVGEKVLYDPWLTKPPLRVGTVSTTGGSSTIDDKGVTSTVVLKEGPGAPTVSTASFGEIPFGKFPGKPMGWWVDVLFKITERIDEVQIRAYYSADELEALKLKEGSLRLFWWDGQKWKTCSKNSVDKKNDFVWTKLNLKSKPTPSDLTGTMFAVGVPKAGFAWWLIPLIIAIVLLLLFVFRLFWVLVVKREGGYTSID